VGETVQRWTGREAKLLRAAMRMTQRDFAVRLGRSERAIAKWESGGSEYAPGTETQMLLDIALRQASDEDRERFHEVALGPTTAAVPAGVAAGALDISSHKFIPAFVGADSVQELGRRFGATRASSWLGLSMVSLPHRSGFSRTLYLAPCGVVLFHVVEDPSPATLAELAVWRYRTYGEDRGWVESFLADAGCRSADGAAVDPPYVLSAYWLGSTPWDEATTDTALRLLACPSVLVDRTEPDDVRPVAPRVEDAFLATGFDNPELASVGVAGVSAGYVGWSGVSFHPLAPERCLTVDELVEIEVSVQIMWCFAQHVQDAAETGRALDLNEDFGWRFVRGARSRLASARPNDTVQVRTMREAVVATSGLTQMLQGAQDTLRDETR
jgi:transcriptional regulator with XRE-family HTH domain